MTENRDELHHLIDSLPEEQVAQVLADVRRRTKPRPVASENPFAWIGMIDEGPVDASSPERIDSELAKGFGRR